MTTSDGVEPPRSVGDEPALPAWCPGIKLTPFEERVVENAKSGQPTDRATPCEGERLVRAGVLRHLLVRQKWPVAAKGVELGWVLITGPVDLESAILRCPLVLDHCCLDADMCLDFARASRIRLTNCEMKRLSGRKLSAQELDLSGSRLAGVLRLNAANLAGELCCSGAHLNGVDSDRNALVADGLRTGGSVQLNAGFTASGAVRLASAQIKGLFSCHDAELNGKDHEGDALVADGLETSGSVFLDGTFTAAGAVRLPYAHIIGNLYCSGARLSGVDCKGNALVADGLETSGNVFLDEEFTAAGAVRLPYAHITSLCCDNARLAGHDGGKALVADALETSGSVFLDEAFSSAGPISFTSAQVGGAMKLEPKELAGAGQIALNCARSRIKGSLRWAPCGQVLGEVNLQGADAGELDDDWSGERAAANGYWPEYGSLRLDGFTYGRFSGDKQANPEQRLNWVRSQYDQRAPCKANEQSGWKKLLVPGRWRKKSDNGNTIAFATQPYEHLAFVYRRSGQDADARMVAIARRADKRKYGGLRWYAKFGSWLFDKTVKYGYQSWRPAIALAVLYAVVLVFALYASHHNGIMPVGNGKSITPPPSAMACTGSYPCFEPWGYAVDVVIPIINVHQAQYWGPNGHSQWGISWVVGIWLGTVLGWLLITLLVAGLTSLIRRQN